MNKFIKLPLFLGSVTLVFCTALAVVQGVCQPIIDERAEKAKIEALSNLYSGITAANDVESDLTNYKRIGLGDAIKIEYSEKTGISFEEIEKNKHLYRQDLINLGNKRRSEESDYWIKKVIKMEGNIIVPDVRVKRELEFFRYP